MKSTVTFASKHCNADINWQSQNFPYVNSFRVLPMLHQSGHGYEVLVPYANLMAIANAFGKLAALQLFTKHNLKTRACSQDPMSAMAISYPYVDHCKLFTNSLIEHRWMILLDLAHRTNVQGGQWAVTNDNKTKTQQWTLYLYWSNIMFHITAHTYLCSTRCQRGQCQNHSPYGKQVTNCQAGILGWSMSRVIIGHPICWTHIDIYINKYNIHTHPPVLHLTSGQMITPSENLMNCQSKRFTGHKSLLD